MEKENVIYENDENLLAHNVVTHLFHFMFSKVETRLNMRENIIMICKIIHYREEEKND